MSKVAGLLLLTAAASSVAWADEPSLSPHIDEIKNSFPADKSQPDVGSPYIDSLKAKAPKTYNEGDPSVGYTEKLRSELKPVEGESYLDKKKAELGNAEPGGAIEAVKEGRSELKAKIVGDIHHAFGFRIGATINPDLTAEAGLQGGDFKSIYSGAMKLPDFNVFYEYQPWHSEWWGSFGLMASAGLGIFRNGTGALQVNLTKPANLGGGKFGISSEVSCDLYDMPLVLGIDYRFNLFKYLRPFVMGGAMAVAVYEQRNDGHDAHAADGRGIYAAGGVSVLMDWLSKTASWDLYAEHSIKHYYLTVEYDVASAFNGPISFTAQGVYAGFSFEF